MTVTGAPAALYRCSRTPLVSGNPVSEKSHLMRLYHRQWIERSAVLSGPPHSNRTLITPLPYGAQPQKRGPEAAELTSIRQISLNN